MFISTRRSFKCPCILKLAAWFARVSVINVAKVHFLIGAASTEAVNIDQTVLVMLPEAIRPAAIATYSGQLQPGVRALVRLGSSTNLFTNHFLPRLGAVDENVLLVKRRELESTERELESLSGDVWKRTGIFPGYLTSKHLIDRKLYLVLEKHRRQAPLTSKDLNPLVDASYASLRRTAGATASRKQKIRDYIESGEYEASLMDWLARFVNPVFSSFEKAITLGAEIRALENQNRSVHDPGLERDLTAALAEIAAGETCDRNIHGLNIKQWLEELIGCEVRPRFFAAIREVREGLTKNGCLALESPKGVKGLPQPAPEFISLDKFSSIVSAFDRALSHVLIAYTKADPAMDILSQGHALHSGLLIRAFLGETDAVRTLYPKHVVGISNRPDLDESLVAKARQAYEDGLMARLCARHYGLDKDALCVVLERAVSIQQRILPLLPFEVHRLVDALEARIGLKKLVEKHRTSGGRLMNPAQANNLRATLHAQAFRGQEITKGLKALFQADLAKMFFLDDALMHEIEALFGNELGFLRTVLANYIERRKRENDSNTAGESDDEA